MLAVLPSMATTTTTTINTTISTTGTHDLELPNERHPWLGGKDPYKICGRGEIWDGNLCPVGEVCVQDRRGYRENFIRVCNKPSLGCTRNMAWNCPPLHVCYAADRTNPRFIRGECLKPLPPGTDPEVPFKIRRLDEQYPERIWRGT